MRTKFKGKLSLLFLALAMVLAVPATVFADTLSDANDDLATNAASLKLGDIKAGETKTGFVNLIVDCSGQKHADPGALVFDPVGKALNTGSKGSTAEVSVTPSVTIPQDWPRDNTSCPTTTTRALGAAQVSVTAGTELGSRSVKITLTTPNITDVSGTSNFDVTYNVVDSTSPPPADTDGDGVADTADNCPNVANAGQADADGDGQGDVCDSDRDGDEVGNSIDNCADAANADQADNDNDGVGNVCDPDSTPPVISKVVTGTLGSNGWYTSDVNVDWTVSDPESAISAQSGCADFSVTSDQNSTTYTCTATSAGGTSTDSVTIKSDATAPGFNCGTADGNWHAGNVNIACTASDGGSDLADATNDASFNLSTSVAAGDENSNASTGSRTVLDNAGNSVTAPAIGGNKIDRKAPGFSCDVPDGQWHAGNVSLGCTASDGGSGLASTTPASFSLSTSVTDGNENDNAFTGSRNVADAVGNTATAGPIGGNKVDKKAPGYSCPADDGTWHAANQNFDCTASDNGSGLNPLADANFTLSTNVAAGFETSSASTGSKLLTDAVGNNVRAPAITGIKVDRKAPGLSYVGQTAASANFNVAGSNGWFVSPVQVEFSVTDDGSGLANGVTSPFTRDSGAQQGSAVTVASGAIKDAVGNEAASINSSDSFKIDTIKPILSPSVSPDPVQLNGSAVASANATDVNGSLIASSNCGSVNTSSVGAKSVSCSATDNAGNTDSANVNYSVQYGSGFGGILQPINGGLTTSLTTNQSDAAFGDDNSRVKLGSTVPVKFQLKDANQALVTNAIARLHVRKLDSTPDAGVDETLPLVSSTTGNQFRYDVTSGQYIFNLSTKNVHTNPNGTTVTFAQGTYNLAVLLEDGTLRSFNFNIVK